MAVASLGDLYTTLHVWGCQSMFRVGTEAHPSLARVPACDRLFLGIKRWLAARVSHLPKRWATCTLPAGQHETQPDLSRVVPAPCRHSHARTSLQVRYAVISRAANARNSLAKAANAVVSGASIPSYTVPTLLSVYVKRLHWFAAILLRC